jgi:hypothetical protein
MHRSHRLALAVASALALAQGPAFAAEKCYDFARLPTDARWGVDTSQLIDIGEVRIRPLVIKGQPFEAANPDKQFLRMQDQQIAGGQRPELYGAQVAMQIVPSQRVRVLRMRFAHQPGPDGKRPSFIEVNGEKHDFEGSFAKLNGRTMGQGTSWRAEAKADLAPSGADSLWHAGTLAVRSTQGGIDQVTIGAQFFRVDDVCIER